MSGPLFASLNGLPIVGANLVIPYSGIWHADVTMDRAVDVVGPQVLSLAGATFAPCTIIRAIDFAGQRSLRLVGGMGGWRKEVPALPYDLPGGVPTATILADAAATVGEVPPVLDPTVPPIVGSHWLRSKGKASELLNQILGSSWWMDFTGIVQSKPRLPTVIISPFTAIEVNGSAGQYTINTESPGDWVPGAVFSGPTVSGVVNRVTHTLTGGHLNTEVMINTPTNSDRLRGAQSALLDGLLSKLLYYIPWNYKVVAVTSTTPPITISARSVDPRMPDITSMTLWPGPSGVVSVPLPGATVRLGFVGGDPSLPQLIGTDPHSAPLEILGYATIIQMGDAAATPVTKVAWSAGVAAALTTFCGAVSGSSDPTLVTAASALSTALGALPPAPTTKFLAT